MNVWANYTDAGKKKPPAMTIAELCKVRGLSYQKTRKLFIKQGSPVKRLNINIGKAANFYNMAEIKQWAELQISQGLL